jgi:hypothetical protein
MHVTAFNGAEAVRRTIRALTFAPEVPSRHGYTRERTGLSLTVGHGNDTLVEMAHFDPRLAAAEALHLISGEPYGERILGITAHLGSNRWAPDKPSIGTRIRDYLPAIVAKLERDPYTRQAVLPIWRATDLGTGVEDYLCATGLQFLMRGRTLDLIVGWRSNDAWHGLPYNLFAFGQLQATMARALGVDVGSLTFQVGSMHLYDRHLEKALIASRMGMKPGPMLDGVGTLNDRPPRLAWRSAAWRAYLLLLDELPAPATDSELGLYSLLG